MILNKLDGGKYRIEIGLPFSYMSYIDVEDPRIKNSAFGNLYYTNLMYRNLHPVDLIPMVPKISKKLINQIKQGAQTKQLTPEQQKQLEHTLSFLYEPDYEEGVKHYNSLLKMYRIVDEGKTVSYVRMYATDNTQIAESLNSNFEELPVKQFLDSVGESIKNLPGIGSAVDLYRKIQKSAYLTPTEIERAVSKISGGNKLLGFISQVVDAGARGLKIDFPKVWSDTQYNRTLNLSVSLSCPYGSPKALWQWVYAELLVIVLLGTPINIYGFIGAPLYVRVRAYGQGDIVLGAIQSITINRGGSNTMFNRYKQPMKLDLTVSIVDLYSQFSAEYSQLKEKPFNSPRALTEPIPHNASPLSNDYISPQPGVTNILKSFIPYQDEDVPSTTELIKEQPLNEEATKRFTFSRRKK